jgi:hypothetical protein
MPMRFRTAVACLLLAACAAPEEPTDVAMTAPQEVTFTATDFAFAGPDTLAPGLTTIRMVNNGTQEHHIILGKLADGRTMADLMAAFQANPNAEPEFLTWVGGAGSAMPGASSNATQDLDAGTYVLICFVPDVTDSAMTPHLAKGMIRELVVTGERVEATAPTAVGEIVMSDFAFALPTMTAGTHTFRVVNNGPQTHEVTMVRLNDGATMEQYMAALAPGATAPPPGVVVGGNGALSNGRSNWFSMTLEPGNYLVLCFVPDAADGQPHIVKGMVTPVTIAAAM